jgi:CRISPR-associated exonuclease Cas4
MDTDPIPLSALQHYSYCPRQCALIHQEQTFTENVHTVRGRLEHERVDDPGRRMEKGIIVHTAVPLWSERLGLIGKADVIETLADGTLYPVEYKHGARRKREHDDVQLAAQVICLEEMTGRSIHEAAIFHHGSHRRRAVSMTPELRGRVEVLVSNVRELFETGRMPPPADDPAVCRECSLKEACQPDMVKSACRIHELAGTLYDPADESMTAST